MDEREKSVYMAKLAEQAERYEGKTAFLWAKGQIFGFSE